MVGKKYSRSTLQPPQNPIPVFAILVANTFKKKENIIRRVIVSSHLYTGNTRLCSWILNLPRTYQCIYTTKKTFSRVFLEILKRALRKFSLGTGTKMVNDSVSTTKEVQYWYITLSIVFGFAISYHVAVSLQLTSLPAVCSSVSHSSGTWEIK